MLYQNVHRPTSELNVIDSCCSTVVGLLLVNKYSLDVLDVVISLSLSLHINGHFPGEPGLASVY